MKIRSRRVELSLAAAVSATLLAAQASAQETNTGVLQEVVVTGSFIPTLPEDAAIPVEVITYEDLQDMGRPSNLDMIKGLTEVGQSIGELDRQTGYPIDAATVNLRNLGPRFTTVVFNNRDRALSDRFLLRWNNLGKYTEETLGLEWFSEVTLFQRLNERTGIAWQNYVSGATDAEVDMQRVGARAILRRQLTPAWLFLEVRAGVGWPRMKVDEPRERSFEGGIAFEMQFSDERL